MSKPLKSVALLADPSDDLLEKLLSKSKVDYIQLHGDESPERVEEIAKITKVPLIKAIGVEKNSDLLNIRYYERFADYMLLDSKINQNIEFQSYTTSLISRHVTSFISLSFNTFLNSSELNTSKSNCLHREPYSG